MGEESYTLGLPGEFWCGANFGLWTAVAITAFYRGGLIGAVVGMLAFASALFQFEKARE